MIPFHGKPILHLKKKKHSYEELKCRKHCDVNTPKGQKHLVNWLDDKKQSS
jgi:hypothetical protein